MSGNNENTQSIDIIGLLVLLWNRRMRIVINCCIAFVLAVIIAFSIPKEYTSKVVMAPEVSAGSGLAGGLGEIASMAGVSLGGMSGEGDALYPELYPQIVSSTPFLMDVLSMEVVSESGDSIILYDYINKYTKCAWWTKLYTVPIAFVKSLFISEETDSAMAAPVEGYTMRLSKKQFLTMLKLDKSIAISVDKGNYLVTIDVEMQDKVIAATVANIVADKLKEYIKDYRSAKARKDLHYTETLYEEFKQKYIDAQKAYAEYANLHQNVVNKKYQVELDRLQNEMGLAFSMYSQMAQTLEMARAKVQENTPVCVVIEPAYIQVKASSPRKMMMAALYVFLAFFGTVSWIIVKDRIINK